LDLSHPLDPTGNSMMPIPSAQFSFNNNTNELETSISGYCNGTDAKYTINENYLDVLDRGGTTLSDCGGHEETEYFTPITGNIYLQQPAKKVYYSINNDQNGFTLWSDINHKLAFEQKVLSTKEEFLEKAISIYPNPANEFIAVQIKEAAIIIDNISIIDVKGNVILKRQTNFEKIDISKLASGIYFLRIKSNNIIIVKTIVKE